MAQPQLRHQAWEPGEQNRVGLALGSEHSVSPWAVNVAQSEAHHQEYGLDDRGDVDSTRVHGCGGAVSEVDHPTDVMTRLMDALVAASRTTAGRTRAAHVPHSERGAGPARRASWRPRPHRWTRTRPQCGPRRAQDAAPSQVTPLVVLADPHGRPGRAVDRRLAQSSSASRRHRHPRQPEPGHFVTEPRRPQHEHGNTTSRRGTHHVEWYSRIPQPSRIAIRTPAGQRARPTAGCQRASNSTR